MWRVLLAFFAMVLASSVPLHKLSLLPLTPIRSAYAQQTTGNDIFSFYQTALAVAQAIHERDLSIICQQRVPDKIQIFTNDGDMSVTFLAGRPKKVVLAVFSKNPLTSPQTTIHFDGKFQQGVEWMFVFDRNRDGKIDYILWPVGVFAYVEGSLPPGFPARPGPGGVFGMSSEQWALLQRYSRMIFWHWADDNFEGKRSAVIFEAWDPGGLFAVTGWQVIRSSHFDGVLDQCWYFNQNIADKTAECERVDQGYKTRNLSAQVFTPDDMAKASAWLSILNEAAGLCALKEDSF